jgi:hydrogenase maturation protease
MTQERQRYPRKNTLILGIGNLLMGDEGAGIHVIRRLQKHRELSDIEIVDGGTGGVILLDFFLEKDLVIVADAALDRREPGTVTRLKPVYSKDYPKTRLVHDLGLKDILDALHLYDKKPEVVLFTISIAEVRDVGMELSPRIRDAVPQAAEKIRAYLESITV